MASRDTAPVVMDSEFIPLNDGLDALREQLRNKKVFHIVDICKAIDEDNALQSLVEWRKNDILLLIDEINNDESNRHYIGVSKKNKFARIISQYANVTQDVDNISNLTDEPNENSEEDKPCEQHNVDQLASYLQSNNSYDVLYKILNENKIILDDLKQIKESESDEFAKDLRLSVTQKLRFRKLVKSFIIPKANKLMPSMFENETKQSEDDRQHIYDQQQAKKKSEKSHQSNTLQADEKITDEDKKCARNDDQLASYLQSNNSYHVLYTILNKNKIALDDLKQIKASESDAFAKDLRLSVGQKLRFRKLVKSLNIQKANKSQSSHDTNETKQEAGEDTQSQYDKIQAQKKSEKSKRESRLRADHKMTVVLVGDTGAGKSSLMDNFYGDKFVLNKCSTISFKSIFTLETFCGLTVEVHVIDTAGQARWQAACKPHYKKADCIFLCYDSAKHDPFTNLVYWRCAIEEYAPDDVIVMLVGCQIDKLKGNHNINTQYHKNRYKLTKNLEKDIWNKYHATHFECSSRTGENVEVLFLSAIEAIMSKRGLIQSIADKIHSAGKKKYDKSSKHKVADSSTCAQALHVAKLKQEIKTLKAKNDLLSRIESDTITVILIGDTSNGITYLADFRRGKFIQMINGKATKVEVIPTGGESAHGQHEWKTVYKKADCVFICYDPSKQDPFTNLGHWWKAINNYAPDDVIVMMVACHMNRNIITNNVFKARHFECNLKTGQNVERLFETSVKAVLRSRNPHQLVSESKMNHKTIHLEQMHRYQYEENNCCE